jgi:hypothetical protein
MLPVAMYTMHAAAAAAAAAAATVPNRALKRRPSSSAATAKMRSLSEGETCVHALHQRYSSVWHSAAVCSMMVDLYN